MIGPVSSTGRAMMASLQQAMAKGMPPDQAIQYVKSMATQGVAPLTDLYAMMNQFQRLKQQPAQAPQTPPTIKDQLNMLDQQQQMQQGNIQQMQAPAPAGVPMDRGLGAIDAGRMEYPQFAGGGIVAFDDGGQVKEGGFWSRLASGFAASGGASPYATEAIVRGPELKKGPLAEALSSASDEDIASALANAAMTGDQQAVNDMTVVLRQRNRKDLADQVLSTAKKQKETQTASLRAAQLGLGAPTGAATAPVISTAPTAPTRKIMKPAAAAPAAAAPAEPAKEDTTEAEYAKLQAFRKREGLGGAREEMRQFLTDEEKRLDKSYGEDRRLAFADVGFKMAAAASRPGATFLGALAEGAMSGTQAMRAINKELNDNKRLLKQSMLKLKEAEELEKEGDYKAAMGLNKEARAEALKLYELRESLKIDREKIAAQRESTAAAREATEFAQAESRDIKRLELYRSRLRDNPEYEQLSLRAAGAANDPEKLAAIRANMAAIERSARREVGLDSEASAPAAQPGAVPTRFKYDIKSGQMIPIG